MQCFPRPDYDKRMMAGRGTVVHAAVSCKHLNGYYNTACGTLFSTRVGGAKVVDSTKKITCKRCLRAIGGDQPDPNEVPKMFVLKEKDTGMYYNSGGGRHSQWVNDINGATLYRKRESAEEVGSRYVYRKHGRIIPEDEFYQVNWAYRKERGYLSRIEFDFDKYEIVNAIVMEL